MRPRPRRGAGVLHPAAGELVAERAQQQVGVGGGHDAELMARDVVLLHGFTHTGASWDPVVAALARTLSRARAGHPRARVGVRARAGHARGGARRRGGRSRRRGSRSPATRWAAGSRCTPRSRCADRVDRLVLIGASPGIADPVERDARRAADERLADEVDRMTIEQFAERWAQTPVLAGQPPAVAVSRPRRPAAQSAGWARRGRSAGWARARSRRCGTGCPRSACRSRSSSASATRSSRRSRPRWRADYRPRSVVVIPDTGHAVHLEAPERVAALIESGRPGGRPRSPVRTRRRRPRAASRCSAPSGRSRPARGRGPRRRRARHGRRRSVLRSVLKTRLSAA